MLRKIIGFYITKKNYYDVGLLELSNFCMKYAKAIITILTKSKFICHKFSGTFHDSNRV